MPLQRLDSLSEIAPQAWDRLVPQAQPFVRHAFLSALEDSASLGPQSGWQPEHLLHWEGDRLLAALPSYRKWHSYGEYVFDHGWADACERAGIDYYPKLLTAVPFSPVSGPRLLAATADDGFELLKSLPGYLEIEGLSSAHINFTDELADTALAQQPGWLQRLGCQFHWQNRGYRDFQDFLDALSSRKRKQMRKEREQVAGQGIDFEWLQGHELSEAQWDFVYACYANTYAVRRQSPYLTRAFFSLLAERMPEAIRVVLARLEFIINRMIGVHPKALLNYDGLPQEIKDSVDKRIAGYSDPVGFYVEKLVEGISTLAGAFTPKKVIVRLSDFKSNEYANLIGGKLYEPEEENPMLGFRGASRYISENFRDCFELECRALKRVRNEMGFTNVEIMVPFVRTLGEASQVIDLLAKNGLKRGENGLRIIMMCELPSNAILAEEFLEYFDGFSIGSNDLTQLTLGLDRDSGVIAHLFDERNPAVKKLLSNAIQACNKAGKYIGICGQGPSDHPDLALWLMEQGIESVSLNPDSVLETWFFLAEGQAKA